MTKDELRSAAESLEKQLRETRDAIAEFDAREKKEKYGDKFACKFCKYSAVTGFSDDGWHNVCGAGICTCCRGCCDKYEPDTNVTLFIKQRVGEKVVRLGRIQAGGVITSDAYNALVRLGVDILKISSGGVSEERALEVLQVIFKDRIKD